MTFQPKKNKETIEQVLKRMRELELADFDWDEWLENEAYACYMYEKITGQPLNDDTYAMKFEAFKDMLRKDPNFKKSDD